MLIKGGCEVACGMCLLLVECVYCLWSVSIACGMWLMLVEHVYCLFNVSNACLMGLMLVKSAVACLTCGMLL